MLFDQFRERIARFRSRLKSGGIRVRGEVELSLFRPEYERAVRRDLCAGRSLKDNWVDKITITNSIQQGYDMMAALLAYRSMEGGHFGDWGILYSDLGQPNRYLQRPECVYYQNPGATRKFTYWLERSTCPDSDDTARFLCIVPARLDWVEGVDFTDPGHPHIGHGVNDPTFTVSTVRLKGPWIKEMETRILHANGGAFSADLGAFHVTSMPIMVGETATGTLDILGDFADYKLSSDRHNVEITNLGNLLAGCDVSCVESCLPLDLASDCGGNMFAQVTLSDTISKTTEFLMAIDWRIKFSPP